MGTVVFAFLLIMVAGGFIAYFGDRLGYIMGKKRVTLFGLRPRHTATTLTVIAGVLIGGFALSVLIIVDHTFQVALLNGEHLVRDEIRLSKTNRHLKIEANTDLSIATKAQTAASQAVSQMNDAKAGLGLAQRDLDSAKKDVKQEQTQLVQRQAELASLTSSLNTEQLQLNIVQSEVNLDQKKLNAATLRLEQDVEHRRLAGLIYRDQGEVGRTVIAASESPNEIRADLVLFLQRLSQSAQSRGAKIGANGRSVIIASIEDSGHLVNENGSLDALTSNIHSYGVGDVVVVASAFGNSFDGDHVIIVLRPYADILAIRSGTEIARTVIDGRNTSVNDIAAEITGFLVGQVRPTARKAGVIPVKNALTGAEELGDISLQQIYEIVSQIREINGPATVIASVPSDIYSADQLKLVFTVKAESPG